MSGKANTVMGGERGSAETVRAAARVHPRLIEVRRGRRAGPEGSMSSTCDPVSASLRAFAVVEIVACAGRSMSLTEIMAAVGLPKTTVHRILGLLVNSGLLLRESEGRRYGVGARLAQIGLQALMYSSVRGARRGILQQLVDELGENCNFTVRDGNEVVYLDQVESAAPPRIHLRPGSRVPLHCTASGKLLLAMLPQARRAALLDHLALRRYTEYTITARARLEQALDKIRRDGLSTEAEEYLPGLACVAVPVLSREGRPCASLAVHAPIARMPLDKALSHVPALRRAAESMTRTLREDEMSQPKTGWGAMHQHRI